MYIDHLYVLCNAKQFHFEDQCRVSRNRIKSGESGIEYIVRSWAKTADYWTAYYALLENIKAAFDEKSVEMPYNHLNVHIVDPLRVERETKA